MASTTVTSGSNSPDIREDIIKAWVARIGNQMRATAAAYAEFTVGTHIPWGELPWIEATLLPALPAHGMLGAVKIYHVKGEVSQCDCWSSPCQHSSGRKLVVTLV